jgi:WD40 repeat protein
VKRRGIRFSILLLVAGWITWWAAPVKPRYEFPNHTAARTGSDRVLGATVSRDGRWGVTMRRTRNGLGTTAEYGPLILFDVGRGREGVELAATPAKVTFSPDSSLAVVGRDIWDVPQGKRIAELPGGYQPETSCLTFSSDGRYVAYTGETQKPQGIRPWIRVWDRQTKTDIVTLDSHEGPIAISRDGRWLACTIADQGQQAELPWEIGVYAMPTGRRAAAYQVDDEAEHGWFDRRLTFSPDGRRLAAARRMNGRDRESWHRVDVVNTASGTRELQFDGHWTVCPESELRFSATGDYLGCVGVGENTCELWDVRQAPAQVIAPATALSQLTFSPAGTWAVSLGVGDRSEDAARIWSFADIEISSRNLLQDGQIVHSFLMSLDGKRFLAQQASATTVLGRRAMIHVGDLDSGKVRHSIPAPTSMFRVFIEASGTYVGVQLSDGTFQLWDLPPRKPWLGIVLCWLGESFLAAIVCFRSSSSRRPTADAAEGTTGVSNG